jgi:hypothetical protein
MEPEDIVDIAEYEADTSRSVTDWVGPEGGAVRLANGKACIDIPAGAVTDSVRVTIEPGSGDTTLPPEIRAPSGDVGSIRPS